MSVNIIIQEGGVGKQLSVDKLKTNLVGGGTCLWVPEDETQLGTKHISENGTYRASDDGYYGYSEVTVSGVGTATGKDSDGDEAVAYDHDGYLVVEKVPSRIEIIQPPAKLVYTDGESITIAGIVVKAYYESTGEYGTVPVAELSFEPTTAQYDESAAHEGTAEDENVNTWLAQPIQWADVSTTKVYSGTGDNKYLSQEIRVYGTQAGYINSNNKKVAILASAGEQVGTQLDISYNRAGEKISESINAINGTPYTINGKTVYWNAFTWGGSGANTAVGLPINTPDYSGTNDNTAWVMIYGNVEDAGAEQTITVKWTPPHGTRELTADYNITVQRGSAS